MISCLDKGLRMEWNYGIRYAKFKKNNKPRQRYDIFFEFIFEHLLIM